MRVSFSETATVAVTVTAVKMVSGVAVANIGDRSGDRTVVTLVTVVDSGKQ